MLKQEAESLFMPLRLKALLWPAIFTLAAGTILIGLGIWQLERLQWKEDLIAQIDTRSTMPPQPLPPLADWGSLAPEDYDYRHVEAEGTFEHDKEALVFHGPGFSRKGISTPGYLVLTPLRLASGGIVIVNRGFVPENLKDRATRLEGEIAGPVKITGLMRPPEPRNAFTPADDPAAGRYFTRDPALIAAGFGLAGAAPFSIDADDVPMPGGWPKGGTTEIAIPNNHLSYALTWFGLAFGLFAVFIAFAWRKGNEVEKTA
jgi:surfeit locus 1 family protein